MAEDHWQPARLIPTSGISGQDEAERRATSALLAVMAAVREFGFAMVRPLGAPAGALQTFIEVPFKMTDGRTCYPDGVLQASRAGRTWTTLVEVKTGSADLERLQVETYLDIARDNGFDAVLTVSNQLAPAPGVHPVEVDRRKIRRVALHHLSWAEVLTIAVQQRIHRGVSDIDQAWILGELIRYLEHPRSGALDFSDMGAAWVPVREAVAAGTLRANDKGLADLVSRWEQLLRFAALRLGRELGADVQVATSRKEAAEPQLRIAGQTRSLVTTGTLTGTLRIPDAIAPMDVAADLRSGRVTVSVEVDAPKDGRANTRVNWLVRQLKDAPDLLRVDAYAAGARTSTSQLLGVLRDDVSLLIDNPKRELRLFRVTSTSPLGPKRGTGRGGFIDSVLTAIDGFYGAVVQQLRPWAAKAPQLPRGGRSAAEEAGLELAPPPEDLLEPTFDGQDTTSSAVEPRDRDQCGVEQPDADAALQVISADSAFAALGVNEAGPDTTAPQSRSNDLTVGTELDSEYIDDESPAAWHASAVLSDPDDTDPQVVWDDAQVRLDEERAVSSPP